MTSRRGQPARSVALDRPSAFSLARRAHFSVSFVVATSLTVAVAGCAAGPHDAAPETRAAQAIIDGTPAPDYPGVVYVARIGGGGFGGCTGTLIAPRVVLTAKHCVVDLSEENLFPECLGRALGYTLVPARSMFAGVGQSLDALSEVQSAEEVRLTGDSDLVVGDDVALLILRRPLSATPYPYARTIPEPEEIVRIVGYGIRGITGRGASGSRYQVDDTVYARSSCTHDDEFDVGGPSVCQGDSGGPAFNAAGEVTGVVSRGAPDGAGNQCGGRSTFGAVAAHVAWIEQALRDTGVCLPEEGGERCDGDDNDCDGQIDEDCDPPGAPCETAETCLGGMCEPVGVDGAMICTAPCHPFSSGAAISGLATCPTGLFCRALGCEGRCAPGDRGTAAEGADCTLDTDCASAHCVDPGDGHRRCLYPCQGTRGQCGLDEICSGGDEASCGACVPAFESGNANRAGEPCGTAGETCMDGLTCLVDGEAQYCSAACGEGLAACPEGYHCRGNQCARAEPLPNGAPCVANEDCAGGACATQGQDAFCTGACAGDCGPGLACTEVSGINVCTPAAALDGESCESDADCVSRSCSSFGAERVCTRGCGAALTCPSSFDCVEDDARRLACRPPPREPYEAGGGCATSAPGAHSKPVASLVMGLAMAAFCIVRRKRRVGSRGTRRSSR